MPIIANNTKPSKAKVLIGTNEHTGSVNSWRLKSATPMDAVVDVSGVQRVYVGDPTFTLDLDISQDWGTVGSLADLLWTSRGTTATIIVQDANATWTQKVILMVPAEIGGDFGKAPHNVVSLPVVEGIPAKTAAV